MVFGHINKVVGLTRFSDKKMTDHLFGPQKSGRNKGVIVRRGFKVFVLITGKLQTLKRILVFRNMGDDQCIRPAS